MRIGSGDMRGRRLHAPRGERTRPTSGRLKKALFDVLAGRLPQARVLDLYAGSGALAFEALSRGAAEAVVVERNRKACDSIRRNASELRLDERVEVLAMDVSSAVSKLRHRGARFDVIFADPPYRSSEPEDLLVHLGDEHLLAEGGLLVMEHHHKRELRDRYGSLSRLRVLKAGESILTLFGPE
ncbi:MAG: 16S rRNA (guanine(966)-N(2))-methyltransferase RsmD [Vicinamibacteria bacterium]